MRNSEKNFHQGCLGDSRQRRKSDNTERVWVERRCRFGRESLSPIVKTKY